ncbi:uncharacterized protein PRD47_011322 [Ara ararauna]
MNITLHYNYVKRYQRDDSETLEDIVIFSATDGFNTADGVLRVQVITNSAIPQGPDLHVKDKPQYGTLENVLPSAGYEKINAGFMEAFRAPQDQTPCPPSSASSGREGATGTWTTAAQAGAGGLMLLYMHNDTESLEDSFTMQLTDGKRTVQGTLYIYIMPVNDEIPHLSRSVPTGTFDNPLILNNHLGDIVLLAKPVTLTEGDRVTLTTDVPVATDGTSKPEKLLYAVSLPPVHGQIEHINYPGVPISSYSQLDVVARKVSDVHDNSHGAGKESVSGHKRHTTELAGFFNLLNGGSGGGVVGDFIFQMVFFPEEMANSTEKSLL